MSNQFHRVIPPKTLAEVSCGKLVVVEIKGKEKVVTKTGKSAVFSGNCWVRDHSLNSNNPDSRILLSSDTSVLRWA